MSSLETFSVLTWSFLELIGIVLMFNLDSRLNMLVEVKAWPQKRFDVFLSLILNQSCFRLGFDLLSTP